MSKINAIRFINLNYNNNSIKISDETFQMQGRSTLMSLRNGGGKSVMVQMMIAPFVHSRYRRTPDRPFESFFTTAKPSFIMIEWKLDQGAGYCLTGMMVRRNQNIVEKNEAANDNALEMINFIAEYDKRCEYDIYNIPVVVKEAKEINLKSFRECRMLFENYKKDINKKFNYFDMYSDASSRQYFAKLAEYRIYYREWESIIKKVNIEESGLSKFFTDCKDEKNLIEKWFLYVVENKLDRNGCVKGYKEMVTKYVTQYNANRSQIKKRESIADFYRDVEPLKERAEEYCKKQENETERRLDIAYFIAELEIFDTFLKDENDENEQKIIDKTKECSELELKEASLYIHNLLDVQKTYVGEMELSQIESDSLLQRIKQKEHMIHILECADQKKKKEEEEAEFLLVSEKRQITLNEEKMLEPERQSIGGRLKKYYLQRGEEINTQLLDVEERINENLVKLKNDKVRRDNENENIRQLSAIIGKLSGEAERFNRTEDEFNFEFNENFSRLITGEYEPGFIHITEERYENENTDAVRKLEQSRREVNLKQGMHLSLTKRLDDLKNEEYSLDTQIRIIEERLAVMKHEIEDRRRIIRYLNVPDTKLWKREEIIQAADRKCSEIDAVRKELERKNDKLRKEYKALSSGQTVELSDEMKEHLAGLDIQPVYGQEWLSKNGFDEARNIELVKKNPFIPYALILSQKQLQKLMNSTQKGVFTSFPIPILEREKLEMSVISDNAGFVTLEGIHFYMLFNDLLLNVEELNKILSAKQEEIKKLEEEISNRISEYKQTMERKSCIMNQLVTKEDYDLLCDSLEENEKAKKDNAELIEKSKVEKEQLERDIVDINILIRDYENEVNDIQRKKKRFKVFAEEYSEYLAKKEEKANAEAEKNRSCGMFELLNTNIADEEEKAVELENERREIRGHAKDNADRLGIYAEYDEADTVDDENDIKSLEARYTAISTEFSRNVSELEEQYLKSQKRYLNEKKSLDRMMEKYSVTFEEIEGREYDDDEAQRLESEKKRLSMQKDLKDEQYHKAKEQYARIDGQISACRKDLSEKFQVNEPLPKSEIPLIDYLQAINIVKNEINIINSYIVCNKEHLHSINYSLTTLSEYNGENNITVNRPEFKEKYFSDLTNTPDTDKIKNSDVFCMSDVALREKTGMLIRDLKSVVGEKRQIRERAEKELHKIMEKEIYREDDFKACMETLCESLEDAMSFAEQLDVVLRSFDTILKKLEIDLAIIEREREEVEGMLLDYVKEIHANLGMMDRNSTITIRNRPIKMLRLSLPEWETNEQMYEIHLHDYMQEITDKSLEFFDKNELPTEFIETRITTKALYDVIVGVGNIQIKLYKIEAEREYPITWNEAAKNSGGEGFLSAFVILSCLLYYMRKDDMDLFSEKNEGKVLIMDNPFAQTNAPHLLKPLMEMAKKTNTQLICLTGLGGDAIYSCFDNIYALKLVTASMRNGLEYMKSEHIRGSEEQTIIASHVEVYDQMSFI